MAMVAFAATTMPGVPPAVRKALSSAVAEDLAALPHLSGRFGRPVGRPQVLEGKPEAEEWYRAVAFEFGSLLMELKKGGISFADRSFREKIANELCKYFDRLLNSQMDEILKAASETPPMVAAVELVRIVLNIGANSSRARAIVYPSSRNRATHLS
jgi:hypothetical protein